MCECFSALSVPFHLCKLSLSLFLSLSLSFSLSLKLALNRTQTPTHHLWSSLQHTHTHSLSQPLKLQCAFYLLSARTFSLAFSAHTSYSMHTMRPLSRTPSLTFSCTPTHTLQFHFYSQRHKFSKWLFRLKESFIQSIGLSVNLFIDSRHSK